MAFDNFWQNTLLAIFSQTTAQSPWAAWIPTIREGFKLYQLVQVFPPWLQAAFIFGFINLALVLYDVNVARAALRGEHGLDQSNVLPCRILLQRGIMLSGTFFLISLFGPVAIITALFFYCLFTCRYFLSGALILCLLIFNTTLYQINTF